jgi:chromosome segregation ATPase
VSPGPWAPAIDLAAAAPASSGVAAAEGSLLLRGCHSLSNGDVIEYTVGSGRGGPSHVRRHYRGRRRGRIQLQPAAHSGGDGGDFRAATPIRHRARSGPIPLSQLLSRAHQALQETGAEILREWGALEAKHQCLSDWRS